MQTLDFSPKDVAETEIFTFDFVNLLATGETILSATCYAAVKSGVDANPSSMVSGVSTISGTKVSQKYTGGLNGVYYCLYCIVTTSLGQTIKMLGHVRVTGGC